MQLNELEQTRDWLKANQVPHDNPNYRIFNDHRYAIVASSHPHGLFARVISEGKEYHYCNGELHIVYDEQGNEIWRLKYSTNTAQYGKE